MQPEHPQVDRPDLEIHVPISPNEHFFTMVHYLAASLRRLGPPMSDVPVVVTVGEDCEPFDLAARTPWSRRYPIRWVWLDRDLFRREGVYATANERYRLRTRASHVLMLDADVLVLRDLSSLVDAVRRSGAIHGLTAHLSPFLAQNAIAEEPRPNADWWDALYRTAGLDPVHYRCQHTGWKIMFDDPQYRHCPIYFNFGVVIGPTAAMREIGATIYGEMAHVESVLTTHFKCQLALGMSIERLRLPFRELRLSDNFPNREIFVKGYPGEAREIRVLHYLGTEDQAFSKSVDMANVESVRRFLGRSGLGVANTLLRDALAAIQPIVDADFDATSPL